jgi:hypothetical protein
MARGAVSAAKSQNLALVLQGKFSSQDRHISGRGRITREEGNSALGIGLTKNNNFRDTSI